MQSQPERMPQYGGMQHNMLRDYAASMSGTAPFSAMQAMADTSDSAAISPFPEQTPPGMAYIPFQQWEEPYDLDTGFPIGTIFSVLDYPLRGGDACV